MNRQYKREMKKQEQKKKSAPRPTPKPAAASATKQRTKPGQFVRDVVAELQTVAWPTRQEVVS